MTDNEIIKALECCLTNFCQECSLYGECRSTEKGRMDIILDLINRQKAEIERLQSDLTLKTYDYEHLLMKCKELQSISAGRKDRLMQTVVKLQTAKFEAKKEFAERLKEKKREVATSVNVLSYAVTVSDINNLLKEMEKENE